jgi:uncharacterized protein YecT (DUF1311 family)
MKNQITFVAILLLLPTVTQTAFANLVDYRAMYSRCLKEAGGTNNTSVTQCSRKTFEASAQEMNRLYSRVYQRIAAQKAGDAKQFELTQKSWLTYRDNHCKLAGAYVGSPLYAYRKHAENPGLSSRG